MTNVRLTPSRIAIGLFIWTISMFENYAIAQLPTKVYEHDCVHQKGKIINESKVFSTNEEIIEKYDKITKKKPIILSELNGARVCSIYYFSKEDRIVHKGEFTSFQLTNLQAYKFIRLEDCLTLLQMLQDSELLNQHTEVTENKIHIRSNIVGLDIQTIEESLQLGKSDATDFYYTFENLKNKYLTISIKHPACEDTIIEIDKRGHFAYVRMNFKNSFLRDEFNTLKGQGDVKGLRSLQAISIDETLYHEIARCADSLEIDTFSKKETSDDIQKFLVDHPYSSLYNEASKVRQYYKNAEAMYTAAKAANTIKDYESYLENFKYTIHRDEIKQLLVDVACRYYSKDVGKSDSILFCFEKYIVPNLSERWIEKYDSSIKSSMQDALIAENTSTTIKQFADHWSKVSSFEKAAQFDMASYKASFRVPICNLYFIELKKTTSTATQDSLASSYLRDFHSYESWTDAKNDTEDFIRYIITNADNKNGNLNLLNSGFLVEYLSINVPGFSRGIFDYKNEDRLVQAISSEAIMAWNSNKLDSATAFNNGQIELQITFSNFPKCEIINLYENGALIQESHFEDGALIYNYAFENGVNTSIVALSDNIKKAEGLFAEGKLEEAGEYFEKAQNRYPSNLPENIKLAESLVKYNEAVQKRNAEKKAAEELAKKTEKEIADANAMERDYGKKIKDEIIGAFTIRSILGQEAGENEYQKIIEETQSKLIKRTFTNEDIIVFNSLFKEAEEEFKIYVSLMNSSSGSSNSNYSARDNSSNNSNSCHECNGTGRCTTCNTPQRKNNFVSCKGTETRDEFRPGYTVCQDCHGRGVIITNVGCNCGGWCTERDCYVRGCTDGWVECRDCRSNPGLCNKCRGTGKED
jgi:hypothetical protein